MFFCHYKEGILQMITFRVRAIWHSIRNDRSRGRHCFEVLQKEAISKVEWIFFAINARFCQTFR